MPSATATPSTGFTTEERAARKERAREVTAITCANDNWASGDSDLAVIDFGRVGAGFEVRPVIRPYHPPHERATVPQLDRRPAKPGPIEGATDVD